MYQLNKLTPLVKKKKRIGRGGKLGGTSGKGHKGQKARSGKKVRAGFEGGQMPLIRRLPKRGFGNARFTTEYSIFNLEILDSKFEENSVVDKKALVAKGLLKGRKPLVKILGAGSLSKKLTVHADAMSESAKKAIEERGGQVHLTKEM